MAENVDVDFESFMDLQDNPEYIGMIALSEKFYKRLPKTSKNTFSKVIDKLQSHADLDVTEFSKGWYEIVNEELGYAISIQSEYTDSFILASVKLHDSNRSFPANSEMEVSIFLESHTVDNTVQTILALYGMHDQEYSAISKDSFYSVKLSKMELDNALYNRVKTYLRDLYSDPILDD